MKPTWVRPGRRNDANFCILFLFFWHRYARADWMMQHRGPRSLRYVDVAFRDDGRCSYLSNKALDSGTARHSHDRSLFPLIGLFRQN